MTVSDKPILIWKYANRKLYDTSHSGYIVLKDLKDYIIQGQEFKIIEYETKKDITIDQLIKIAFNFNQNKSKQSFNSNFLKEVIKAGGLNEYIIDKYPGEKAFLNPSSEKGRPFDKSIFYRVPTRKSKKRLLNLSLSPGLTLGKNVLSKSMTLTGDASKLVPKLSSGSNK